MNINKIIKEEINSFDWVNDAEIQVDMDLRQDYLVIWPRFEKMFADLGVPWLEGTIQSNDYDGEMFLEIRSEDFMVDVGITQTFHADSVGDLITYSMYDPDEYDRTLITGEYEPYFSWGTSNDYLKPVIEKLRELVVSLIDELNIRNKQT